MQFPVANYALICYSKIFAIAAVICYSLWHATNVLSYFLIANVFVPLPPSHAQWGCGSVFRNRSHVVRSTKKMEQSARLDHRQKKGRDWKRALIAESSASRSRNVWNAINSRSNIEFILLV